MKAYRDWAPTEFDRKGALLAPDYANHDGRQDWLVVPVIRTRDSRPLETSNFETAWSLIEDAALGEDLSAESHKFNHWGPGWFEIILVRPGSRAAQAAERIEARLEEYPVLDEDDLSAREWERAAETWEAFGIADRVRAIQRYGDGRVFAARRAEIPNDPTGSLLQYLSA